jgi:hypothetical protein
MQAGGALENSGDQIEIVHDSSTFNKKFKVSTRNLTVLITMNQSSFISANRAIEKFIKIIHEKLVVLMNELDKISLMINHPSLDIPIIFPFIRKPDFTTSLITNNFIKVCQSKRALNIDDLLIIKAQIAEIPHGRGLEMDKILNKFRSIITIKNSDSKCGLYAFIVGILIAENKKRICDLVRVKNNKILNQYAATFKGFIPPSGCDLEKMREIESHFKAYQLIIYDEISAISLKYIYCGEVKTKKIFLLLYQNHYFTIRSPARFLNNNHFCMLCVTPHNDTTLLHKCLNPNVCKFCKQLNCEQISDDQKCKGCKKTCKSVQCLERHLIICSHKAFCTACCKYYYNNSRHTCGERENVTFCNNCQIYENLRFSML